MKNRRALGILDLILGILLFLAGLYALRHPLTALAGVVVFYGILAVATGIVDIVFYARMEQRTGFGPVTALIAGIFSIFTGILLLLRPGAGGLSLAILFPIWFIAHCISELARLPLLRWNGGRVAYWFSLVINILGLLLGLLMLVSPALSLFSLPWMAGLYLLLLGVNSIVLGIQNIISHR